MNASLGHPADPVQVPMPSPLPGECHGETEGDSAPSDGYDLGTPILDHVSDHLHLLDDREARVVARHFRLEGPFGFLEDFASGMGISRPGMQVIRRRALARLDARTGCFTALKARLAELRARSPIALAEVMAEPWTAGMPILILQDVLEHYGTLYPVDVAWAGRSYLPFRQRAWNAMASMLAEVVDRALPSATPEEMLRAFAGRLDVEGDPLAAALRLARSLIDGRDGLGAKVAFGCALPWILHLVPPKGGRVTLGEILDRVNASAPDVIKADYLRSILREEVIHLGGDVYCRQVTTKAEDEFGLRCEAEIRQGEPGRRWSTAEILTAMRDAGVPIPRGVTVETLDRVLLGCAFLDRPVPGQWQAATGLALPSPEAMAEEILEREGRPMLRADLERQVFTIRGRPKWAQLRQTDRMVALGDGLWGLAERDLPLDAAAADRVLECATREYDSGTRSLAALYAVLSARGEAGDLGNAQVLGSLLRARGGMRVGRDDVLRQAGKGPPLEPGTHKRAIVEAMKRHPDGITYAEASEAVLEELGVAPATASIRKAFRHHGTRVGRRFKLRPETLA